MPKIIHFHYNTPENTNIGDEAHVLAIQDVLHQHIKNLEITNFPISFLCHYQIPPTIPGSHAMPVAIHNAARILRGMSYRSLIKTINEADMVVIGGGGVYMGHLLPFNENLLRRTNVPIVVFGAGYNHNFGEKEFNKQQLQSITTLGHLARLQSVRDKNTFNFLVAHDVESILVGDPAVFLEKSPQELKLGSRRGISIAINIAAHDWKMQAQYESTLLEAYAHMMLDLQKRHDIQFYYFIHHPNESKVVDALTKKGIQFASVVNDDARTTKAAYSKMDLTVSMMLHSTILAFGEGVPAVCVGYDSKNKSFMDLTNQADRYIAVQDVSSEELTQRVETLVIDYKEAGDAIKIELAKQRSQYDMFAKRVAELLNY
jgi:polysaccharide pyruvyl transferase WcaK-like protein